LKINLWLDKERIEVFYNECNALYNAFKLRHIIELLIPLVIFIKYISIMGGNQSIEYATPISEKPEGSTAIYRHPLFKTGLVDSPA
jgi:hypothetical protein